MKKFLSLLLAILMVLSLMTNIIISASAEDAAEEDSIVVPMDSNWDQCVLKENWEGEAKVQYRGFAAGSSHGPGGFMFRYGNGGKVAATDISGMKYIIFDVYVTNVADIAEVEFSFELTSSGDSDKEESAKKFFGKDTGWVNGWNHVVWSLDEFNVKNGEFDRTRWNFIRWYNDLTLNVGSEKLMVSIANLMFSTSENATPPVKEENAEFVQLGEEFLADFNQYGETTAAKETFMPDSSAPVKKALANADMLAKWNWLWVYMLNHLKATNPDATSAYLTDAYSVLEKMINGDTTAILDNANARTTIRSYIHGFLNAMKGCGDINPDFSTFSPDFSSAEEQNKLLAAKQTGGEQPDVPEEPKLDGIVIPMDTGWDQCWKEENFHDEFAQIRVYGNGGSYGPGGFMFRYNEGGKKAEAVDLTKYSYIEFDVYVSNVDFIAEVEFSFELTSSGTSDKEESAKKFKGKDTGWVNGWNHVKWGLDEFTAKNGEFDPSRWNFIRWYNDTTLAADGFFEVGIANLHFTQKSAAELDAEEETKTEHSVPLWGCNTNWDAASDPWKVDNENQLTGSGCITLNLKNGYEVMAPEKHFATPIDATGMDTLEFDIYLSDLAIIAYFSDTDGAIELTSSGTSDQAEVAYNLRNLTKYALSDAKVGWNHVSIKIKNMEALDGAAGAFDISKVNFIRFYWVYPPACDQDWIIKLDNFRLTDKVAQEEAEKEKDAQVILNKLADFLAEIDALKSIADSTLTAETYEAAKAQYDAVKAKYDALPENEQTVLSDNGYARKMSDALKPITKYEEALEKMAALKDIIDALTALEAYANAEAFTYENYDSAKTQIEEARKAYEALVRSDKKFLEDNGFLAYLTAAEAAMPAKKPEAPSTDVPGTDEPGTDVPGTDEPSVDEPGTDEPGTDEPGTDNTDKPTEEPKEEGGCKSALTIGAVATMILAGAWVTIAARKKEI